MWVQRVRIVAAAGSLEMPAHSVPGLIQGRHFEYDMVAVLHGTRHREEAIHAEARTARRCIGPFMTYDPVAFHWSSSHSMWHTCCLSTASSCSRHEAGVHCSCCGTSLGSDTIFDFARSNTTPCAHMEPGTPRYLAIPATTSIHACLYISGSDASLPGRPKLVDPADHAMWRVLYARPSFGRGLS